MITRIVRMEFHPGHVDDFLAQFDRVKNLIRAYPGVQHLELLRDAGLANVFYTYSKWDDERALEVYRESELFKRAWSQVKPWFVEKPQAFSLLDEMVVERH
jgi:autoinducer 2-degrading protein